MSSAKPIPDRLRVLFVDDEAPIRTVIAAELPRMGHDVTVCEDYETALEALEASCFDAVIIDLRIPGLGGWDGIQHIKRVAPHTEIIISTGHGDMDDAIRALRLGAYDFLPKPSQLITIENVLRRVSEKRASTKKNIALETRLKSLEGTSDHS